MTCDLWITVHCEGKGTTRHGSKMIERFSRMDGEWYAHVVSGTGAVILGHARQRGGVQRTRDGYRFECPKCALNSRVSERLISAALDTLEANGLDRIDLGTLNALAHNGSWL
jgi:hypothetical protein